MDKSDPEFRQLEQARKKRKLKNFKSLIRPIDAHPPSRLARKRKSANGEHAKLNRRQLTSELNEIVRTIEDLEQQELGNTYHREREKKLKSLMRSSKLADMRRALNEQDSDSERWLRTHTEERPNPLLDPTFRMKKCPKCALYFPLEKIARHCRTCDR